MEYKTLDRVKRAQLIECVNKAFSDYAVKICFDEISFEKYIIGSGVDLSLSFCAVHGSEIVGFILNSVNIYNGDKSAFIAGTGVIPACRGKGVFSNIYKVSETELGKKGVKRYYLEVLQQNDKAIRLYKSKGFTVSRELSVMQCRQPLKRDCNFKYQIIPLNQFDFSKFRQLTIVSPSYEHCEQVINGRDSYCVALSESEKKFCIYDKENGSLIQLGYENLDGLQQLLSEIISNYNVVTAKNIDLKFTEVVNMLHEIGFNEIVRQFEMVKEL